MPKLCHGSEAEFYLHHKDLHSFVLEDLRQKEELSYDIKNADIKIENAEGARVRDMRFFSF